MISVGWSSVSCSRTTASRLRLSRSVPGTVIAFRPVSWAEAIERALAAALGPGDEAIQALAFLGCHPFGEAVVEVRAGARAHPCHRAFQNRETGQQHLGREQPGDGAIEQRRWPVRAKIGR